MQEYAEKKCEKLTRYFDRIQQIEVIVDHDKTAYEVEIIAHVEHHDPFIGSDRTHDYYACVDQVMDKLTRQLSDHKEKMRNRKHPD